MLIVCEQCLQAIMSHEGRVKYMPYDPEDDGNEEETRICDWCEEECDNYELYTL